jgi:hypothetical protein
MGSTADAGDKRELVAAPVALAGVVALGVLAVIFLPDVVDDLPLPGKVVQARYAAACSAVITLTALYVVAVAITRPGLDRKWIAWTTGYGSALAFVKFMLSPIAFSKSSETSLGGFVTAGLLVLPLYLAALGAMYALAARRRDGWAWGSKIGFALLLAVVAVAARLLVSLVLGTSSDYLDDLIGVGLILPIVVAAASIAVMESFSRARPRPAEAFRVSIVLVLVQHVLWTVYMYRLFA